MPAPSADPAARTAVINELSALAQSVWFTLLGALAFLGIVLLSTTDADFLLNSSETELPLVRIAVPTERFFFLAPIVTTVLYLYLHFFCLKLWAQFCARGALADGINPEDWDAFTKGLVDILPSFLEKFERLRDVAGTPVDPALTALVNHEQAIFRFAELEQADQPKESLKPLVDHLRRPA